MIMGENHRGVAIAIIVAIGSACSSRPDAGSEATGLAAPLPEQLTALPLGPTDLATIEAVEAEATAFPRDSVVNPIPRHWLERPPELEEQIGPPPVLVGGPSRECVRVPAEDGHIVRSGEFVVGGVLSALVHGRPIKFWWKPLNSSMNMELLVRGRSLGTPSDTLRFESSDVTSTLDSETLEPYEEEAAFVGIAFPSAGTWVVVATSGRNWGCFVIAVR